jgi:hypothetical protein
VFPWKLIWQALAVTVILALISGPVFWSDSLSRRFFKLDKKKPDPKQPPG